MTMKQHIFYLITILCLLPFLAALPARAADAVVGTGTPASCTEAAFDAALTTASSGGGTITFNCGPAETTITFSSTKFLNLGNVTVNGNGRIVLSGNNNDRHFFVGGGITFQLQNITLRDGNSLVNGGAIEASGATVVLDNVQLLNNTSSVAGGAIYCYDGTLTIQNSLLQNNSSPTAGAIFNDGCTVGIHHSTLQSNLASGGIGRGGAIENAPLGVLTLTHTTLQNNSATDGGGLFVASGSTAVLENVTLADNSGGYGGGVENNGDLTIRNSLIDNNAVTGSGGGLWNISGTAVVEKSTFSNNFAYEGGAISTYGVSLELREVNLVSNYANAFSGTPHGGGLHHVGGTAFITNATIQGNYASGNGGGIYQSSDDNLVLTNVTIAENVAAGLGGGMYHYGRYALLINTTIGNNTAGVGGQAIYEDSPQTPQDPGVIQIVNSVIFGSANNCDGGFFQSFGYNISQGSCASLTQPTDQDNTASGLLLGALGFNGGAFPMQTILPLTGSPLVDAADPNSCTPADQRGASRVGACDIGAVEYGAVAFQLYLPMVVR